MEVNILQNFIIEQWFVNVHVDRGFNPIMECHSKFKLGLHVSYIISSSSSVVMNEESKIEVSRPHKVQTRNAS